MQNKKPRKNEEGQSRSRTSRGNGAVNSSSSKEDNYIAQILLLPDVILLHVFSFLSVKEKCKTAQVCKSFRRLVKDKQLWKCIDLSSRPLPLREFSKFARSYFSPSLRCLKIRGFVWRAEKKTCLSNAFLDEMRNIAPKITTFSIKNGDLRQIDSSYFPRKLEKLVLETCEINTGFLQGAIQAGALSHCKHLDMSHSSKFKDVDVASLSSLKELKELILLDCYRLTDKAIDHLCKSHTSLEKLWVGPGGFTDESLCLIGQNMTKLKMLGFRNAEFLTGKCLQHLKSLKHLEELDVSYNHQIKDEEVEALVECLPKLTKIHVNDVEMLQAPLIGIRKNIQVL